MDQIQKELIKAGHKDLAQEYYKKISKVLNREDVNFLDSIKKKLSENAMQLALYTPLSDDLSKRELSDIATSVTKLAKELESLYVGAKAANKQSAHRFNLLDLIFETLGIEKIPNVTDQALLDAHPNLKNVLNEAQRELDKVNWSQVKNVLASKR